MHDRVSHKSLRLTMKSCLLLATAVAGLLTVAQGSMVPVEIEARCDNVHLQELGENEHSYMAYLLRRSYSIVHFVQHHDFLTKVAWKGRANAQADDPGYFTGLLGCDGCPDDEEPSDHSDKYLAAWQDTLQQLMADAEGRFEALRPATGCTIKLMVADRITSRELITSPKPVTIQIDCQHVDWARLPATSLSLAAEALQSAYNDVHLATEGSFLNGVAPLQDDKPSEATALRRIRVQTVENGVAFEGVWFSSHDNNDSMDADADHVNFKAPSLHAAWEAVFLARLVFDPSHDFADVRSCSITIALKQ